METRNEIYQLFPTHVWEIKLPESEYANLNETLKKSIFDQLPNHESDKVRESIQTSNHLHKEPEFRELTEIIEKAGSSILDFLQTEQKALEITGCWGNINPPGTGHQPHIHPNNYLSGVYYVDVPKGGDQICFFEPRQQLEMTAPKFVQKTEQNSNMVTLTVTNGTLLVFPAWFRHAVPPNRSTKNRLSISFNLMFSDFTKTMSSPLWKGASKE